MSLAPRQSALEILLDIEASRATLDQRMDRFHRESRLDRRDEAFVTALVYGVLRWRARLDVIIDRLSRTPMRRIDRRTANILRLGLYQILYMDRVPDSAAVNTSVDLAKRSGKKWLSGFVNAVLRNAVRGLPEIGTLAPDPNPFRCLATEHAMPEWLIERWIDIWGPEETEALCRAVNQIPPLAIRTNTLKISRSDLLEAFADLAEKTAPTSFAPDGIILDCLKKPLFASTAFENGWFQVQDEAAQAVGHLLAPRPGQKVLDACAGLGGKTAHAAALMQNRGTVMALDRDARKLNKLDQEMQRLGIPIVSSHAVDLQAEALNPHDWGRFDRILLDAPCSGLGVLRRNPDAKWTRTPEDIARCAAKQNQLLHHLAPVLKAGGVLVYAVCSTEPEETQAILDAFLKERTDFAIDGTLPDFPNSLTALLDEQGILRTAPHRHGTDGFFAVRLRRQASS
jgi:16S rRNA (cytosine967-C5)-methyltransferase